MIRQTGMRPVRMTRAGVGPENTLTFTSGLTRVGDTITNDLITGKAGGQTILGGTGAGDNLTLQSTSNATRGAILASDRLQITITDAVTAATVDGLTLRHLPTGLGAAGLGVTFAVELKSDAGTTRRGMTDVTSLVSATDGAESARRTISTMIGGVPTLTAAFGEYVTVPMLYVGDAAWTHGLRAVSSGLLQILCGGINAFSLTTSLITSGVRHAFADRVTMTPAATASAALTKLSLTPAADTGTTASTEALDVDFDLSRTRTWATGALATQRAFVVRAPTYAFVGASTITTAATLAITAAPIAGANATITNPYALWVQAGLSLLAGGLLSPTLTGGTGAAGSLTLQSTTNATRGAIVCNDALGVGRTPGVLGSPPQFAVAGNVTTASAAAATLDYVVVNAATVTVTGATNITTAAGFNYVSLEAPAIATTVNIGAGGTTPASATLTIKAAPSISGGGAFVGGGPVALWVQTGATNLGGTLTVVGNLNLTTGLVVTGTTSTWTATSMIVDIGANTMTVTGGLSVSGAVSALAGILLTGVLVLNSDTAANGTGAVVTLPNFGGAGRPVAGTPAGWWHMKQSGNDRYIPFWGP